MQDGKPLLLTKYEVLIIGAGAGGSAAAIHCAQAGLKVALIERQEFPRHRPGETLHPGIEPLLDQLGVGEQIRAANFLRHEGNWVDWGEEQGLMPFGSDKQGIWRGFQVFRADFDSILLDKAGELGVEIIQPCRALGVLQEQGRVVRVKTSRGDIMAQVVIDAGGGFHWLTRQLKLAIPKFSQPQLVYYGYATGECPARDQYPAIVADEKGWTWTAKVSNHLYQWTRFPFKQTKLEPHWLPSEFAELKPQGAMLKADVTWRAVEQPAGKGYFVVGDAASVLDPASSHGVLKAIMSGIMAGHAISKILGSPQLESSIIQEYSDWILNWFQQDLLKLKQFYQKSISYKL